MVHYLERLVAGGMSEGDKEDLPKEGEGVGEGDVGEEVGKEVSGEEVIVSDVGGEGEVERSEDVEQSQDTKPVEVEGMQTEVSGGKVGRKKSERKSVSGKGEEIGMSEVVEGGREEEYTLLAITGHVIHVGGMDVAGR